MKNYDLIVAGGGTAGVSAAYCAGMLGLKTLLIEKNSYLGGSITGALVVPMMKNNALTMNREFLDALIYEAKKFHAQITYHDGNTGWFNPTLLKIVLDKMMQDANVQLCFCANLTNVIKDKDKIISIECEQSGSTLSFQSKYYIDSTGDAILSNLAGASFLNDADKSQAYTLRFMAGNVDIKRLADWLKKLDQDENVTTVHQADNEIHLSTAYTWDQNKTWALRPYFEKGIKDGVITEEDSSYFQIFSVASMHGAIAFNCPRIFSVDISDALVEGRVRIYRIMNFVKKYIPGFESAYICDIADMLGIRESRRIEPVKVASIDSEEPEAPILESDYPIDIHSHKKGESLLIKPKEPFKISIDSLRVKGFSNLFAAGRDLGAEFKLHSALRIQSDCMSMGEACAKWIKKNI